jgi:hypothetical protein
MESFQTMIYSKDPNGHFLVWVKAHNISEIGDDPMVDGEDVPPAAQPLSSHQFQSF